MTAPTKLHIETLREMFAVCANERRMKEADAINAAIAALAPPSGEGVDSRVADLLEAAKVVEATCVRHDGMDALAFKQLRVAIERFATPQSAPEE